MAKKATKKSSKNSKNLLQLILDAGTILLGALLLGFLALPHIKGIVTPVFGDVIVTNISGYSLLTFEEGANVGIAVVLLLLVIFASLMIASGLVKFACDFGILKNDMVSKIAGFATLLTALAVAVLVVVNIFTVSGACSGEGTDLFFVKGDSKAVWATLIINACLGVGTVATSLLSLKK